MFHAVVIFFIAREVVQGEKVIYAGDTLLPIRETDDDPKNRLIQFHLSGTELFPDASFCTTLMPYSFPLEYSQNLKAATHALNHKNCLSKPRAHTERGIYDYKEIKFSNEELRKLCVACLTLM